MVLSTRSRTFQNALSDVEEKINSQQIKSSEDLKEYIEKEAIEREIKIHKFIRYELGE